MNTKEALRWAALNRAIAFGSLLLGVGIVALGIGIAYGNSLTLLLEDPLSPGAAFDGNHVITVAAILIGLAIWQLGKAAALVVTVPQAAGVSAAEEFDTVRLRSEVLEALDGRLADLEADMERTRDLVEEQAEEADDPVSGSAR